MPLNFGESINYLIDSLLKAPIVHTITSNPVYFALVITAVIVLIILFIFRDAVTDEPILTVSLRAGFWVLLLLIGALFLNNHVTTAILGAAEKFNEYEDLLNDSYSPNMPDRVPVIPSSDSILEPLRDSGVQHALPHQ